MVQACSRSCTGECSSSCASTCFGDCDNACNTESALTVIDNLGSNIKKDKLISSKDFSELKSAIENELKRRNKSSLIHKNSNSTNLGNIVYKEHIQNIINDIKSVDSSKSFSLNTNNIVYANDLNAPILTIKEFMLENLKS